MYFRGSVIKTGLDFKIYSALVIDKFLRIRIFFTSVVDMQNLAVTTSC